EKERPARNCEMIPGAARIPLDKRTQPESPGEGEHMTDRGSCPDRAILESLALGRLSPEQSRATEDHLLHCDTCLGELETPLDLESLREALRHPPSREETEEPVVSGLIERACRLHPQTATTPPDRAEAVASDATPHEVSGGALGTPPVVPAASGGTDLQVL